MAIPVRQLTSAYAQRYSNTANTPHVQLSRGMVRDVPGYEAPEGSCYDAVNMLCDRPGRIRKRGASTSPTASVLIAAVENLMAFKSSGYDGKTGVAGSTSSIANDGIYAFNTATGGAFAAGAVGASTGSTVAKPFQHATYGVFPFCPNSALSTTYNDILFWAGINAFVSSFAPTAATIVAGDSRITGIAPTSLVSGHVGGFILLRNAGANIYVGKIVEVISSSACRVEPTPKVGFTATSGTAGLASWSWVKNLSFFTSGASDVVSGKYGVSFQGRIVLGNTFRTSGIPNTNYPLGIDPQPNRIYWSQLRSEAIPATTVVSGALDGDPLLFPGAFTGVPTTAPYYNYTDIPNIQGITGLAPVGDGQLLIFGRTSTFRLSGQLSTNTIDNSALDYSVDQISNNVGCVEAKSIAAAVGGLIFAGIDNVYTYDGSSLRGIMTGTNARYYQQRLHNGDKVIGACYYPQTNHYQLTMTGTDGDLMFDMDTYAMTRQTNIQVFNGATDPVDPSIQWGARWWDTTLALPSFTGGQLLRLDPIFSPSSTNKIDANGTDVLCTFISKSYPDGGGLEVNKLFRELHVDFDLRAVTGSPTVQILADTKLLPSDATFLGLNQGTLSKSTVPQVAHMDITNQLSEGKAIEIKAILNAVCDSFEILGVNIGTQARALT